MIQQLLKSLPRCITGPDQINKTLVRETGLIITRSMEEGGKYKVFYAFDDWNIHCQSTPTFSDECLEKALAKLVQYCKDSNLI